MEVLGIVRIDIHVEKLAGDVLVERHMQVMKILEHIHGLGGDAGIIRTGHEVEGIVDRRHNCRGRSHIRIGQVKREQKARAQEE
jgi:hypothetical protein